MTEDTPRFTSKLTVLGGSTSLLAIADELKA
jgi:hypothetical protein